MVVTIVGWIFNEKKKVIVKLIFFKPDTCLFLSFCCRKFILLLSFRVEHEITISEMQIFLV